MLMVPDAIQQVLGGGDVFETLMQMRGKAFRDVKGRKTIQVQLAGRSYFLKQHFGVGWHEIVKNLLSFKKPILGAMTEVRAIEKLNLLGIATTPLVAYGQRGSNPANLESFVLTQDLGDITSLEDLCASWQQSPPDARFKRQIIRQVAEIARRLHENGMNHRDFYLCHFCLDNTLLPHIRLYLIDLHRVLTHAKPSFSANVKDIAALYFSSMDVGLTPRDYLRFKHYYRQQDASFWKKVETRAQKLYAKFNSAKFQDRLAREKSLIQ
jgi:tRNA A-37 threonylcarbamoyl transferase component Bud32